MVHEKIAENGIRVTFAERTDNHSISMHVAVRCGAIYEDAACNGVSHLLEHLHAIQASQNELVRTSTALQAWMELDTAHFSLSVPTPLFAEVAAVFCASLNGITLSGDVINKEKRVISTEVEPTKGRDFLSAIYGRLFSGSSYGLPAGGRKHSIERLSRSQIDEYNRHYYKGANISVSVLGKISQRAEQDIQSSLASNVPFGGPLPVPDMPRPRHGRSYTWETNRGECVMTFSLADSTTPLQLQCLRVISCGFGLINSPFYLKLREAKQSYYEYDSRLDLPGQWGMLIFRCVATYTHQATALIKMAEAIKWLAFPPNEKDMKEWLNEAKQLYLHRAKKELMSPEVYAYYLAVHTVSASTKRFVPDQASTDSMDMIDLSALRETAQKLLHSGNVAVFCDGPRLPLFGSILLSKLRRILG